MSEKYTVEISRQVAGDREVLRTHSSTTPEGAEVLVESIRDSYGQRESVAWEREEVDVDGTLIGRSFVQDATYTITVTPPLPAAVSLEARLARVEARLDSLEGGRPGRKPKPIVVSEEHVCGVDPRCDPGHLPRRFAVPPSEASKGDRCIALTTKYYDDYRKSKRKRK